MVQFQFADPVQGIRGQARGPREKCGQGRALATVGGLLVLRGCTEYWICNGGEYRGGCRGS